MGKTQDKTKDTHVKVSGGYSKDQNTNTTSFIIADRNSSTGSHEHVVISESGGVVHDSTGSL